MKKKFLIIGGIILAVYIIGAIGSSLDSQNQASQDTNEVSSQFTLEEKQKIYYEVVQAEDRGQKEANEQYPTDAGYLNDSGLYKDKEKMTEQLNNNAELVQELQTKYKNEMLEKYGMSKEEFDSIAIEAIENDWAMPEYKSN